MSRGRFQQELRRLGSRGPDAAVLRKANRFGEAKMAEVRAMKIEVKNAIRPAKLETATGAQSATPEQPGNSFQEKTPGSPPV